VTIALTAYCPFVDSLNQLTFLPLTRVGAAQPAYLSFQLREEILFVSKDFSLCSK